TGNPGVQGQQGITGLFGDTLGHVITLTTGGYFAQGKTTFASTVDGFFLGSAAGVGEGRFHIGNETNSLKWDGSSLTTQGVIQTAPAGSSQRVVMDNTTNSLQVFANTGVITEKVVDIGLVSFGTGQYAIGKFGTLTSTSNRVGIYALAYNNHAVRGEAVLGSGGYFTSSNHIGLFAFSSSSSGSAHGIYGEAKGGHGVYGYHNKQETSNYGNGVYGKSNLGSGIYGVTEDKTKSGVEGVNTSGINAADAPWAVGVSGTSTYGIGVSGWTDFGYGIVAGFNENEGACPFKIWPSISDTRPVFAKSIGSMWVTSDGNFYGYSSDGWGKFLKEDSVGNLYTSGVHNWTVANGSYALVLSRTGVIATIHKNTGAALTFDSPAVDSTLAGFQFNQQISCSGNIHASTFSVDNTSLVTNLNAQYLNGQLSTYYAPVASPSFTGNVTTTGNVNTTALNSTGSLWAFNPTGGVYVAGLAGSAYSAIQAYANTTPTYKALALNPNGANVLIGSTTDRVSTLQITGASINTPTAGTGAGQLAILNPSNLYGLLFGTNTNGNTWIQSQRVDGTTTLYNILLQPIGGNVLIGTSTDKGYKLEVAGDTKLGLNCIIGNSGGDYDYIAYNAKPTDITNQYAYSGTDTMSMIKFGSGGFQFLTAPLGTAGNTIITTSVLNITQAGAVTAPVSFTSPIVNGTSYVRSGLSSGLNVVTTTNQIYANSNGASSTLYIQSDSTGNTIINPNGGNVLIGTSTHDSLSRLMVVNSAADSYIRIGSGATGNYAAGLQIGTNTRDWSIISHNGSNSYKFIFSYVGTDAPVSNILTLQKDGNVGIGTLTPGYKLEVNGSFAATTKSFVIDHPTKDGYKLRYGSLEGPENGVYVRGKLKGNDTIDLPEYWTKLVDKDSITVSLTPIGKHQKLYVKEMGCNSIIIGNDNLLNKNIECFYVIYAERIDVKKLIVEIPNVS
ncbi:MAG: hypothetical protein HGA35_00830, partial [Erysipelotrichaceae bacterium]|nr:hypothetical protein [Erysipelotrichaceae bacterium]